jgi:hypothetical protein
MSTHRLKLEYDGLTASENCMPTSLEKQITEGAQIFLAAHATYFTEGRVPDRLMDRSCYYQIQDIRQRPGCWIAEYDLTIAAAGGYFLGIGRDLAKDYLKKAFQELIRHSYQAWKNGRPIVGTPFERIVPTLNMPSERNAPVFDFEAEEEGQRRRLYARVDFGLSKVTAPIGRAATHVDISFDDERLDRIKQRTYSEAEIEEALLPLKAARGALSSDRDLAWRSG